MSTTERQRVRALYNRPEPTQEEVSSFSGRGVTAGGNVLHDPNPQDGGPPQTFDQLAAPPKPLKSEEDAQRLAAILKNPATREALDDDRYNYHIRQLRAWREENPKPVDDAPMPELPAASETVQNSRDRQARAEQARQERNAAGYSTGTITGDALLGPIDLIGTFVTGALAEIPAGLSGAFELATGGDVETANANIEYWRDALTMQPKTNNGRRILNDGVAQAVLKVDEVAAKSSAAMSMGNPYAENVIYTTIATGSQLGMEIAGIKGGRAVSMGRRVRDTQKAARELGIKVDDVSLADTVVDAAKRMTPDEMDANARNLQESLQQVQEAKKVEVDRLREASGRDAQYIMDLDSVEKLGSNASNRLVAEGYDVTHMPTVMSVLDDMNQFKAKQPGAPNKRSGGKNSEPIARLNELDILSGRIEKRLNQLPDDPTIPDAVNERTALQSLNKQIDNFVETQFNRDMIVGDADKLKAWQDYNAARGDLRSFNADKTISNIIEQNATPEQINNWIFGSSTTKPLKQVTATIERFREVLGNDHPAIRGMQTDFLHRIAAPLFDKVPDFKKFLNNFDSLVRERPRVVRAMGLDIDAMKDLRAFAEVANKLNPKNITILGGDFATAVSRYFVGHGIARAGMMVRMSSNVLKLMFGATRPKQLDLLKAVTEARLGEPAVPRGSVTAGRFISSAAIAEWKDRGLEVPADDE